MSKYKQFAFRSPDTKTFLSDVQEVCLNNGLDPVEVGVLKKENGELLPGRGVDVIPKNRWYKTQPNEDGTGGEKGGYALVNVITKDAGVIQIAESFDASDPAKEPSEIASSEKIASGTHRIDMTQIKTPVRVFFGGSPNVPAENIEEL